MKRYNTIIAIDPDIIKSGVATLDRKTRNVQTECLPFPELIEKLRTLPDKENTLVVVEAGWLNKSNWHIDAKDSARSAAAIGRVTGMNHEVGKKILECAVFYGCNTDECKPLRKSWNGKDGKITHEEITRFIHCLPARTNQEVRDAALIAWVYAGLPIKY